MAGEITRENRITPVLPLIVGGILGGGIALIFAPHLAKFRNALCAAGTRTKQMMKRRNLGETAADQEEGIYCAVPEGADICFDEKRST